MLFAVKPLAIVLTSVWPCENAMTFFLVVNVFTFVSSTVVPSKDSSAMHFIKLPLPVKRAAIGPFINAVSVNVVVDEVSFVS
jgi:hypothetical protein